MTPIEELLVAPTAADVIGVLRQAISASEIPKDLVPMMEALGQYIEMISGHLADVQHARDMWKRWVEETAAALGKTERGSISEFAAAVRAERDTMRAALLAHEWYQDGLLPRCSHNCGALPGVVHPSKRVAGEERVYAPTDDHATMHAADCIFAVIVRTP